MRLFALREMFGLTAIKEFQDWLVEMGFVDENGKLTKKQEMHLYF